MGGILLANGVVRSLLATGTDLKSTAGMFLGIQSDILHIISLLTERYELDKLTSVSKFRSFSLKRDSDLNAVTSQKAKSFVKVAGNVNYVCYRLNFSLSITFPAGTSLLNSLKCT